MKSKIIEKTTKDIFSLASIQVNGPNPWDIQIYNKDFYKRALSEAELGIGESYRDDWWKCEKIDEMICRIKGDKKVCINCMNKLNG